MGSSAYCDTLYSARLTEARSKGTDLFTHDSAVRAGKARRAAHDSLNPARLNKAGKLIRESFDSATHPCSVPVAVFFDVTGSMARVPRVFVSKLDKLMASLIKKGFLAHPHILFGAIGDATCDEAPLQIGQFEAGNEMDDVLTNIFLEQGGGGSITESYELALYFMARHTECHAWTKRGKKGYLFMIGDEKPYPAVKKSEVERLLGTSIQEDIPLETILAEVREKFETFWILPSGTSNWNNSSVIQPLQALFGQHFLKLENPEDIVELICSTIGLAEGFDLHAVGAALEEIGADKGAVARASASLVPYASSRAVAAKGSVIGTLSEAPVDAAERV